MVESALVTGGQFIASSFCPINSPQIRDCRIPMLLHFLLPLLSLAAVDLCGVESGNNRSCCSDLGVAVRADCCDCDPQFCGDDCSSLIIFNFVTEDWECHDITGFPYDFFVLDPELVDDGDLTYFCPTHDCAGNEGGSLVYDDCGVCGGSTTIGEPCDTGLDGICAAGTLTCDECEQAVFAIEEVCGNEVDEDCNGIAEECDCTYDLCLVCDGDNRTCCANHGNATLVDEEVVCVCDDGWCENHNCSIAERTVQGFGSLTLQTSTPSLFLTITPDQVCPDHAFEFQFYSLTEDTTTALVGALYAGTQPDDSTVIASASAGSWIVSFELVDNRTLTITMTSADWNFASASNTLDVLIKSSFATPVDAGGVVVMDILNVTIASTALVGGTLDEPVTYSVSGPDITVSLPGTASLMSIVHVINMTLDGVDMVDVVKAALPDDDVVDDATSVSSESTPTNASAIVGGVIGGFVGLAALMACCLYLPGADRRQRKHDHWAKLETHEEYDHGPDDHRHHYNEPRSRWTSGLAEDEIELLTAMRSAEGGLFS